MNKGCCIYFILFILLFDQSARSQIVFDQNAAQDTSTVRQLKELGIQLFYDQEIDSAFAYYRFAAQLVEVLPHTNTDLKLSIWKGLGVLESERDHADSSLIWLEKGLDLIEALGNLPKLQVDFLINKGATYYGIGDVAKALGPYIEATDICRTHGFDEKRAIILNNLGIFYRTLKRYDEAIELYKESFEIRKSLNDSMGMANNLFNLAATYAFVEEYNLSLESVRQARILFEKLNSPTDVLLCELSEGTALMALQKMDDALAILQPLSQKSTEKFTTTHLIMLNLSLAKAFLHFDKLSDAQQLLNQIREVVVTSDRATEKAEYYQLISELNEKKGDFKKAFVNHKLFVEATKIHNDATNKRLRKEMETKYLAKEKDVEIQLLQSEGKVSALELQTAKQRALALSIILLILTGAMVVLYYTFKKIKLKNAQIQKADQEKETLLKEIHHRVKNNLQVISALLTLQSRYVEDKNALEALRLGHDRVESMALIHKDLYQRDNLKGVNTKVYLEKLVANLLSSYHIGEHDITLDMQISEFWLDVDTMIPLGLMINELLSNTMKHAFIGQTGGKLSISLNENHQGLALRIKDNGPGINDFELLKTKSFGYSLIQSFARKLDAEVKYKNDEGLCIDLLIKDYHKVA
jgi:two-component sensor histidine kinase